MSRSTPEKRSRLPSESDQKIIQPPSKKQTNSEGVKTTQSNDNEEPLSTEARRDAPHDRAHRAIDDERVCFGMVVSGIQLDEIQLEPEGSQENGFAKLTMVLCEDRGQAEDDNGTLIALLSKRDHRFFHEMHKAHNIAFCALVRWKVLRSLLSKTDRAKSSVTTTADVLVDGEVEVSDPIGRKLAASHRFLQRPYPSTTRLEYQNPQYLRTKGHPSSFGFQLAPITSTIGIQTESEPKRTSDATEKNDEAVIWAALDLFSVKSGLKEGKIDGRILCELRSHQREGVDFILRSEGVGDPVSSLWEATGTSSRELGPIFRHRIIGCKASAPVEIRGGLLADAMGLGKTLTMIAAIISTLDTAKIRAERSFFEKSRTRDGRLPTKSTLVIVPDELLMKVWTDEVKKHVRPKALNIYRYHGEYRVLKTDAPLEHDIVITTYGTVASESRGANGAETMLRRFNWFRLILDEAHEIRNLKTKQFGAVDALASQTRWCITGTPIQNTVDDLGALIKFLRLPHLNEQGSFRKHISGLRKGSKPNYRNLQILLSTMCLRRHQAVLQLPETSQITHNLTFSQKERREYEVLKEEYLHQRSQREHSDASSSANWMKLKSYIRLQMFCNVGLMVKGSEVDHLFNSEEAIEAHGTNSGGPNSMEQHHTVYAESAFSLRTPQDMVFGGCPPSHLESHGNVNANQDFSKWSTKIRAIRENLLQYLKSDKSIVFSSWCTSLDVLGNALEERKISYCRFDGNMSYRQRASVIERFQADASRVLLVTFGTGATGLNCLSVASRVYLMEPHWNPSVESQAIGRVVRLDQSKKVTVVRYLMQDSIEKDIERRQAVKIGFSRDGGLNVEVGE